MRLDKKKTDDSASALPLVLRGLSDVGDAIRQVTGYPPFGFARGW